MSDPATKRLLGKPMFSLAHKPKVPPARKPFSEKNIDMHIPVMVNNATLRFFCKPLLAMPYKLFRKLVLPRPLLASARMDRYKLIFMAQFSQVSTQDKYENQEYYIGLSVAEAEEKGDWTVFNYEMSVCMYNYVFCYYKKGSLIDPEKCIEDFIVNQVVIQNEKLIVQNDLVLF